MDGEWLTYEQAAVRLGVTPEAANLVGEDSRTADASMGPRPSSSAIGSTGSGSARSRDFATTTLFPSRRRSHADQRNENFGLAYEPQPPRPRTLGGERRQPIRQRGKFGDRLR